jgi:hypothetical protein
MAEPLDLIIEAGLSDPSCVLTLPNGFDEPLAYLSEEGGINVHIAVQRSGSSLWGERPRGRLPQLEVPGDLVEVKLRAGDQYGVRRGGMGGIQARCSAADGNMVARGLHCDIGNRHCNRSSCARGHADRLGDSGLMVRRHGSKWF